MSGFPEKMGGGASPGSIDALMVGKPAEAVKSARSDRYDPEKRVACRLARHLHRRISGKSNKIQ